MFKRLENQENYYRISSADWEYMVVSSSFDEACSEAVKKMMKLHGENLKLSLTIKASKITESKIKTDFFYTPTILSNLGFHRLAESFSTYHDFFLDKGKQSY